MSLKVKAGLKDLVKATCEKAYPEEGCGLLLGPVPDDFDKQGRVVVADEARPLPNGWDSSSKTNRYLIDPRMLAKVEAELSGSGRAVVGFFHSHPNHPAWPSPFDLMMAWPCLSYWIVRVQDGKLSDSRSWQRTEDSRSFIEEEILEA
ncbi:MAG TPA: M67 family metallopeptidase [Elusimicrobiota bacterium]|nr:M67 family metallopeptidase [Elusimicrobiota bacterium]